jgi:arylsulfatase A-like enzyme
VQRFTPTLVLLAWIAGAPALAASSRPNVVIIVADDLGWADVGYHGAPIATPSIDRLAREGLQLGRFYTAPVCTPTRAMLMTGRDPIRMGLAYEQINPWNTAGVPSDEHFMPESFRTAGYQTAMVGKWHLGHSIGRHHPNARGFEYFYGHLNTAVDYWSHTRRKALDWQRNGESVEEQGYATDLQGADAARIIRERDPGRGLFLYVAFNAPHNPMQAPDALLEQYADLPRSDGYLAALTDVPAPLVQRFASFRRIYAAMVASMDAAVGRILDALDAAGIADDTLVLFLSDNGGFNIFGGDNTPLRGQKAQTFEGGIRVPALARWPGRLEAGTRSEQLVSAMDVFPTLTTATGVPAQNTLPFDGEDVWSHLLTGTVGPRAGALFFVSEVPIPGQVFYAARRDRWKLVRVDRPGPLPTVTHLFDLEADPGETRDLSAEHPDIRMDLENRLDAWLRLHPPAGLRRTPSPHPGWLPPKDWARAVPPVDQSQATTQSDFLREGDDGSNAGVLLYRTPAEREVAR